MSETSDAVAVLKRRPVVITIVLGLVVVIVWLLAYFLPQGSKISSLDAQQKTVRQMVALGNAKVARLKHTYQHATELQTMDATLRAYVPTTPDIFKTTANFTSSLSAAVTAAQMTLTSVSPGGAAAPISKSTFTTIPVSLTVKGTYDHLLSLITSIYSLPRLSIIDSVSITGGGVGTSRTTSLTADLALVAFTTAKPPETEP